MTTASGELRNGPFHLIAGTNGGIGSAVGRWCGSWVEKFLAFKRLNRLYATAAAGAGEFAQRALEVLDVKLDVSDTELAAIPRTGPLVVVANHPFGGIDGLALLAMLKRVRPDVKILANHLLRCVPELAEHGIFVDPFGGQGSVERNRASMRQALRWVKSGGALGVFPAGEVSHLSLKGGEVADSTWSPVMGRLIGRSGAAVTPVHFRGRNSAAFQLLGLVHPRLRTALLPREVLNKRGGRVRAEIGKTIPPQKLSRFEAGRELMDYLYIRTRLLGARKQAAEPTAPETDREHEKPSAARQAPIGPAQDAAEMGREVAALGLNHIMAQSGEIVVYVAAAEKIPTVLKEIGRLREATFREVGEGTGQALDLDAFDGHYLHLFAWHRAKGEIVGAYRLGLTDEIIASRGIEGLYTRTLFRYGPQLLREIGPAVELGRSFVRREYQREYAPLLLLWKGIGGFMAAHRRYRRLFGVVSISNAYASTTRDLLVAFLSANRRLGGLSSMVKARRPPRLSRAVRRLSPRASAVIRDFQDVDDLVADLEPEGKGAPVLLRQYLKLNAKALGFNVDPQFSDALDALMLVDLTEVDRGMLTRYLGREHVAAFLAHHGAAMD